jgi:hypothetical protein
MRKLLCEYGIAICKEWIARGYKDTMLDRFVAVHALLPKCEVPAWLGSDSFHASHQSNLNRKDRDHYNFNVEDDLPYLWYEKSIGNLQVWKVGKKPSETKQKTGATL